MNKVNTVTINNILYVQIMDLCKLHPANTKLHKSPCYIIEKYNFIKNKDYFYFKYADNSWQVADGSNKKFHKSFLLCSSAKKYESLLEYFDEPDQKQDNVINDNYFKEDSKKYPIIKLNDDEKFKGEDGTVCTIDTRGFRKHDQIYFRVSNISLCMGIPKLRDVISNKNTSYVENTDYIYIYTTKFHKAMFLTYHGLVRCLFVSRSKNATSFINWSIKTLFAAQFGTDKQKNKLISNIKGISYDIIHDLFSKNARSLPCIYLISLNTVGNLRKTMNIDESHKDDSLAGKFGLTQDFNGRSDGHKSEFKDIADSLDLKLVLYTYIDPIHLRQAEAELAQFVADIKFSYKNHQELVIIPKSDFKNIKNFFEKIGYKYSGHTTQFNQQINDLNNDISKLNSFIDQKDDMMKTLGVQHQLELNNKDLIIANKNMEIIKNEEIYKSKEEVHKSRIEILELKLKYQELLHSQSK